jgi:hypothetical protein
MSRAMGEAFAAMPARVRNLRLHLGLSEAQMAARDGFPRLSEMTATGMVQLVLRAFGSAGQGCVDR